MSNPIKTYSNKDITIKWQPEKCIHSTICWKGENGLLAVFNPRERPWIKPEAAATDQIIEQIKKCPSGALSFTFNAPEQINTEEISLPYCKVSVLENGPLLVDGMIEITNSGGQTIKKESTTAFCRCGQSSNKPFCDGTHVHVNFKG